MYPGRGGGTGSRPLTIHYLRLVHSGSRVRGYGAEEDPGMYALGGGGGGVTFSSWGRVCWKSSINSRFRSGES